MGQGAGPCRLENMSEYVPDDSELSLVWSLFGAGVGPSGWRYSVEEAQ